MAKKDASLDSMKKAISAFHKENGAAIITASKLKACLASMGLRTDGDLKDALAGELYRLLFRAAQRTIDNKRTTVRPCDL